MVTRRVELGIDVTNERRLSECTQHVFEPLAKMTRLLNAEVLDCVCGDLLSIAPSGFRENGLIHSAY